MIEKYHYKHKCACKWFKLKIDMKLKIKKRDLKYNCPKPSSYIWSSIFKFDKITFLTSHRQLLFPKDTGAGQWNQV